MMLECDFSPSSCTLISSYSTKPVKRFAKCYDRVALSALLQCVVRTAPPHRWPPAVSVRTFRHRPLARGWFCVSYVAKCGLVETKIYLLSRHMTDCSLGIEIILQILMRWHALGYSVAHWRSLLLDFICRYQNCRFWTMRWVWSDYHDKIIRILTEYRWPKIHQLELVPSFKKIFAKAIVNRHFGCTGMLYVSYCSYCSYCIKICWHSRTWHNDAFTMSFWETATVRAQEFWWIHTTEPLQCHMLYWTRTRTSSAIRKDLICLIRETSSHIPLSLSYMFRRRVRYEASCRPFTSSFATHLSSLGMSRPLL